MGPICILPLCQNRFLWAVVLLSTDYARITYFHFIESVFERKADSPNY